MSSDLPNQPLEFTTADLVAATEVNGVTFHAYRYRHGLFDSKKALRGWKKFSFIDLCVVRLIHVIAKHGIDPKDVVPAVDGQKIRHFLLRTDFEEILRGKHPAPLLGFCIDTGPPPILEPGASRLRVVRCNTVDDLAGLMMRSNGVLTLIDLGKIVIDVIENLKAAGVEIDVSGLARERAYEEGEPDEKLELVIRRAVSPSSDDQDD